MLNLIKILSDIILGDAILMGKMKGDENFIW